MQIDDFIKQLKELYIIKETVSIFLPQYCDFKDGITKFVFERRLDETDEWKRISDNLIYKSTSYLARSEADNILVNLEKLKRKLLKQENEHFWDYVHPDVYRVSKRKFDDGHYGDAVESAFKEICSRIRKIRAENKTEEITSETDMMRKTFGTNMPLLKFNANADASEKNIQEGYTHIFAGAIQAIRNPSAHGNIELTIADAVRKLMLASDLMYKVDGALLYSNIRGG